MSAETGDAVETFAKEWLAAARALSLPVAFELKAAAQGRRRLRIEVSAEGGADARKVAQLAHALDQLLSAALTAQGHPDAVEIVPRDQPETGHGRPPPPREDAGLAGAARALAENAVRLGRSFAIGPMSVNDRRLVHQALGEVPGVWTQSEGDGIFRRLWIVPRRILQERAAASPPPGGDADGAAT